MNSSNSTPVWRLNGPTFVRRMLRMMLARRLARFRERVGSPQLFCLPGNNIGDAIFADGRYEDSVLTAIFEGLLAGRLEEFSQGVALDVGGDIGNHAIWFSKRFAGVLSFEPNPVCVSVLEANLLLNRADYVALFPIGLSDARAELPFHLNTHGNIGKSGVTPSLAESADRTFQIEVNRRDAVLTDEALKQRPVRLVELDVEGHELEAMTGLAGIIDRFQPIVQFESHGTQGPLGSDRVVDFFVEKGVENFYVIERDRSPFRSRILKAIRRILSGERLRATAVARPGDRPYSLIVANFRPLTVSFCR